MNDIFIEDLLYNPCLDPNFEQKIYSAVYGQFSNIIILLLAVVLYMLCLNILVKYNKINYEQFYQYNYYGFVGLMCIVFVMCAVFIVL